MRFGQPVYFCRFVLCGMIFCALFLSALPGAAQNLPFGPEVPLPGVQTYDIAIPTHKQVIGHEIGTRHTIPAQVVDYFRTVAEVSDRVVFDEHAKSYEGRPLVHAIVTSLANHARLEEIRQANLRLSNNPGAVDDAALASMPAIIYMGYSVHGNEASGTEAALVLLYHLAAGSGAAVEEILDNLVVIIDPMLNPDGRDRFADWANRLRGRAYTVDPQDMEHNEAWPGGRTNHYWFDLNRDWLLLQHPESQGRIALFHHWRPQVLTDFHEMGSDATFFFQPGIPSRTNPNTPQRNQDLTGEIGMYHARALDRVGQLYYTQESFDDFYYGKGSTYPDINGSIGILFEQASSRALARETVYGTLDYARTVRNQFITSLSTLEAAVDIRTKLLDHQRTFYKEAADLARSSAVKAYVIGLEPGRTRAQALAQVLQQHRISIHELVRNVDAGGRTYLAGEAYVIPLNQQQAPLIKAVMERTTKYTDSLFYDVSTWTLPLAYNVNYAEIRQDPARYLGAEIPQIEPDGGAVVGGRGSYGYLMEWSSYFSPRALYKMQEAGVRPVLMHRPISSMVNGQPRLFPRGTVVVAIAQQDIGAEEIHHLVERLAREDHVRFYAADTGLTPNGPDLGSRSATVLEKPTVGLLAGPGTNAYNTGEAWHLLSERFRIPVSLLDATDLADKDLSRYNTLVMAGGNYSDVPVDEIKAWIQEGGRLIAMTSAVDWVKQNALVELVEKDLDVDSLVQDLPYAEIQDAYAAQALGGSIFEATLDTTHPLAYGFAQTLPVFRNSSTAYEPLDQPGTSVAVLTDSPLLSGYISAPRLETVKKSASLIATRMGRGHVMLFADNPNFRAFWWGTNGLFLNAVFFGGTY